jgi:hypothetical protein
MDKILYIYALNKSSFYAFTAGGLKTQVVSFLLGWTSDPNGAACMISLYQEDSAWGNGSYKTLSLLFPVEKGPRQNPP